jgi:hypothetical protein
MAGVQTDIATQDSMGFQGAVPITTTALNSAGYTAIQFAESGTLTSIAGLGFSGTWTGITFPAGFIIRGRITSFQLASGKVVAYLARA